MKINFKNLPVVVEANIKFEVKQMHKPTKAKTVEVCPMVNYHKMFEVSAGIVSV